MKEKKVFNLGFGWGHKSGDRVYIQSDAMGLTNYTHALVDGKEMELKKTDKKGWLVLA